MKCSECGQKTGITNGKCEHCGEGLEQEKHSEKRDYALEVKWTVSKGRDTYGYNICTLYVDGKKAARCNGGGYDMEGTVIGNWAAHEFASRLLALKPEDMPENSHWKRADNRDLKEYTCSLCGHVWRTEYVELTAFDPERFEQCPICEGECTSYQIVNGTLGMNDGERVNDGRSFYGLTYHDPNYDPGKAIIGKDCTDRTFSGKSEGKTVEQAEEDGDTVGLERYQAFYSASSKVPTERHTVPLIDGACGKSSVEAILRAIKCELEYVYTRNENRSVYVLHCTEE